MSAADRVEAFLDSRAKSNGLDPELVHGHNGNDLTVEDLRELVDKARWADAVRAKPSIQRGYFDPQRGRVEKRVLAPYRILTDPDAPKYERPTVISMVVEAPIGDWVEVDCWTH